MGSVAWKITLFRALIYVLSQEGNETVEIDGPFQGHSQREGKR
jgi:hypothetical protein